MGITSVELTIAPLDKPETVIVDDFLVDSGASYTVLPEGIWKRLEIEPKGAVRVSLADGRLGTRQVGFALITYQQNSVPTRVILGEVDDSKLLGVVTLEEMGLSLDPIKRTLLPMSVRM